MVVWFVTVISKMNPRRGRAKKLLYGDNRQWYAADALQAFQLAFASQYHVSIQIFQLDPPHFLKNSVAIPVK